FLSSRYRPQRLVYHSPVITARTPGSFSALDTSMLMIFAWGYGLRFTWAYSMRGIWKSPTYCACPVTLRIASTRSMLWPTYFIRGASFLFLCIGRLAAGCDLLNGFYDP